MKFTFLIFILISFSVSGQTKLPKKDKVKHSNYDEVSLIEDSVYKVKKKDKWAIIDFKENILIDFDHTEIQYFKPKKLFFKKCETSQCYKVYSLDGQSLSEDQIMMSEPMFGLKSDYYKVFRYEEGNMITGLINSQGRTILPTQYNFCSIYYEDKILILNKDTASLFNLNLDTIAYGYDFIGELNYGLISVGTFDKKYGAINEEGNEIVIPKYARPISFDGGAAGASLDGKLFGLIDTLGNPITNMEYDEIKYLIPCNFQVSKNGLYGLFNSKGEEVYPIESTKGFRASYQNSLEVTKDDKMGIIDCNGDMIIPVIFNDIKPMANNYLRLYYYQVFKNGKTGIFDRNGKEVVKVKYDSLILKSRNTVEVISDGVSEIIKVNFEN